MGAIFGERVRQEAGERTLVALLCHKTWTALVARTLVSAAPRLVSALSSGRDIRVEPRFRTPDLTESGLTPILVLAAVAQAVKPAEPRVVSAFPAAIPGTTNACIP